MSDAIYTTRADVDAMIPRAFVVSALADDPDQPGTESAGAWESLVQLAARDIDARLAQRYRVPLAEPVPAVVRMASLHIILEALYLRRGYSGKENPYTASAKSWRDKIDAIARGDEPLTYDASTGETGITIISDDASGVSSWGLNS